MFQPKIVTNVVKSAKIMKEQFRVSLPTETITKLKEMAEKTYRTPSQMMTLLIDEYYSKHQEKDVSRSQERDVSSQLSIFQGN